MSNLFNLKISTDEIRDEILWKIKFRLGKWKLTGKDLYYLTAAVKLLEKNDKREHY